ncbi:MAG: hypothetical protein KAK01_12175, partial [Candidatus Marinimicrobia bacterium]|nr:hypothetical protein [Candidatus Neomarinimicrobiota bacterium]
MQNLVNLQTGVVDGHVRGSRVGDNAYYVDGVLVRNQWNGGNLTNGISRSGTQEVSVQTGGFSAEYGSANGGVVNITSKSGGSTWLGSVEYVTSLGSDPGTDPDAIYDFGYSLLNFDFGGPISKNIRFYFNVEKYSTLDWEEANVTHPEADVFQLNAGDDLSAIWVDGDPVNGLVDGVIYGEMFTRMNQDDPAELVTASATSWGEGLNLDSVALYQPDWVDTTYVYAKNYSQVYGPRKNNTRDKLALTGNITFDMSPLKIKLGGSMYDQKDHSNNSVYQLLNWENNPVEEYSMKLGYINGTFTLSPKSFIRTTLSLKKFTYDRYNPNWEDDVWAYGERTTAIGSDNYYYRDHGLNALVIPALVGYSGYGAQWNNNSFRSENTMGIRTDFLNQMGRHEMKAGFEYYDTDIRYYYVSQARELYQNVSLLDKNYNGAVDDDELTAYDDYDDWLFNVYRNAYTYNIGYDIFGNETDSYSMDNHSMEPGKSTISRMFFADKIEFRDVVLNLGVSYESFDPNTFGPDSDDDGWADDAGFDNIHLTESRVDRTGEPEGSFPWEPVEKYTEIQPRIGFSFPVTDVTVFHAQYGHYWQPPPLVFLYLSDSRLSANLTQGNQTASPNPTLKPERTTSYEIGFTQQLGLNAALDITGFYKEVRDY